MADESKSDLIREILSGENKYIYYLLAATGACIAFAISKTEDAVLSLSHIPWAVAVLSWGLSSYCGLRILMDETVYMSRGIRSETNLAQQFEEPQLERAIRKVRHKRGQFLFLLIGAIFFVVWHFLEMFLRSVE